MSAKHHAFKFVGLNKVYTYDNQLWAAMCRLEPTYTKLDPRWIDVFNYTPETKLIHREIKIKGVKRKVAQRVPTHPRPNDSYRGARRNKVYEDLACRRNCTIH